MRVVAAVLLSGLRVTALGEAPKSFDEVNLGTTLLALKFDGGVVVAADTRTSAGAFVSNKFARKINVIINEDNVSCVICRSGSAADTQFLAREAKMEFRSRFWRYGFQNPLVSEVAHFLRNKMRTDPSGKGFRAGMICAGIDDSGSRIYGISVETGAMWEEDVYCVSGSGSTFLIGYLDSLRLSSSNLQTEDQAVELAVKLLGLSIARDGSSGGLIRTFVLKPGGIKEDTIYPSTPSLVSLPGFAKAGTLTKDYDYKKSMGAP